MDKNFCSNCSTENESEYVYCKNCGAQLKPENESAPVANENINYSQPVPAPQPQPQNNYQTSENRYNAVNFDGVSTEEMNLYIGKKANDIMPKFIKMQITGSKVSWCWPVAVLSFFLGPIGAAFWFFYRKMYKHAALLTVLGAVITFIVTIFSPTLPEEVTMALEDAINAYDIQAILESVKNIDISTLIVSYTMTLIEDIANLVTCVICGIYGFHWYKNDAVEKIHKYRMSQPDPRYYRFGLASIGGVSGGMLALGIVIFCMVSTAASVISAILDFLI